MLTQYWQYYSKLRNLNNAMHGTTPRTKQATVYVVTSCPLADAGGQSGHAPYHGFRGELPSPSKAAAGSVKGRWIMEISFLFARFACDYIKLGVYIAKLHLGIVAM